MARRSAPSPTGVYVAQSAGVFKIDGTLYHYHPGETFPAGHPLLRVRPDAFKPLTFGDRSETLAPEPVATPVIPAPVEPDQAEPED